MSFQQGLSGLNASSQSLEVIGNNIANASTYGAKTARAEFSDVYAAALNGTGTSNIGIGVSVSTVAQQFSQGSITTTSNPMDLAINGGGFFQVSNGDSPPQYSRNGQFKVDANGYIVNNTQQQLMGYAADSSGVIQQGKVVALQLPTGGIPAQATTTLALEMNLDSRSTVPTPPASGAAIDYADPTTYTNATSTTVYDAKGNAVALTYYFQKASTNTTTGDTWNVYATANGLDATTGTSTPTLLTTLTFPPPTATNPSPPPTSSVGSASALPVTITSPSSAFLPITLTADLSKATEFASAFAVTSAVPDGNASGALSSVSIGSDGTIQANYSNGKQLSCGQVLLSNFRNPQGLQPVGNNDWAATQASGAALPPGTPGTGSLGLLQSGALEESNVDLTSELVNMITAQRVYQANAQTIKTQDQVLQTLVSLR